MDEKHDRIQSAHLKSGNALASGRARTWNTGIRLCRR